MKHYSLFSLLILFLTSISSIGQQTQKVKPNFISTSTSMRIADPISKNPILIPAKSSAEEMRDGRYSKDKRASRGKVIIGKGSTGDDLLAKIQQSNALRVPGTPPELVFDTTEQNSQPTDPSLAIGPNHVFSVFNTGWRIFDKSGNALTNEISPNTIFSPGSCCDLTISYDNAADRWMMSILYGNDGHVEVAVSQGPDPINDTWSVYSFANIQDYQKVSVWSDGYYMTANVNSGSASTQNSVFALERDAMLAGADSAQIIGFPLPGIATQGFYSPQAFNVTDSNLPARGNAPIVYMQDDAFSGINEDHIKIWTIDVDFTTPANSTISQPTELPITPFIGGFDGGAFSNLTQPNGGQDIDVLQNTIMNQAQFKKFSTHNSALFNFAVDTDGSAGELAGIRWIELRQSGDGQPWTIYQEGTYTSPDGKHAWNASLIMDNDGNIGMGYTGMAGTTDTFVSSYYTGRFANDPLGTMTIDETLIAAGGGNIPGSERYGDYSKIDIDPSNGKKFWFVTEYVNTAGNRANVAGVFQIAPNNTNDVGTTSINIPAQGLFSNSEEIKINIFNFGIASASNFEVSYQIDGGAAVTETFTGTLESLQSVEFVFAQRADLSTMGQNYTITASTNLDSDEFANGGTAITETVPGPLPAGGTLNYTFTQTADLSQFGAYEIVATSLLPTDSNTSNNSVTVTVNNLDCNSTTNDTPEIIAATGTPIITSTIDVAENTTITDINVTVNIEHTWNEDLTITLTAPDNTTIVELTSDNGGNSDNYINTVFDDDATDLITTGTGPFTGSFQPEGSLADFNGLSSAGTWTLTINDGVDQDGGQLTNWGVQFCNTSTTLSIGENLAPDGNLQILHNDNNQFEISLETNIINERLDLDVFNLMGQRLLNYRLQNNNGKYTYGLDMSYAAKGVYLVRLSNGSNKSEVKRIIVR